MYKIYVDNMKADEQNQLNKWRNIPCSWIRRLNIVSMSVLPNVTQSKPEKVILWILAN